MLLRNIPLQNMKSKIKKNNTVIGQVSNHHIMMKKERMITYLKKNDLARGQKRVILCPNHQKHKILGLSISHSWKWLMKRRENMSRVKKIVIQKFKNSLLKKTKILKNVLTVVEHLYLTDCSSI